MNQPQPFESEHSSTHGSIPALADSARLNLPVAYQTAKQAVALCESTDECRTWADKHAALAAYAKMRDDRDLHNYALRIQLRAERRWGELDRELYPDRHRENLRPAAPRGQKTAETKTPEFLQNSRNVADHNSSAGARPPAADGTSEFQRVTARRLAAIPQAVFESHVESPTPPTKTYLAALGTAHRATPITSASNVRAFQTVAQFAKFCESHGAEELAQTVNPADIDTLREHVGSAEVWLGLFADSLPVDVG